MKDTYRITMPPEIAGGGKSVDPPSGDELLRLLGFHEPEFTAEQCSDADEETTFWRSFADTEMDYSFIAFGEAEDQVQPASKAG
ncbi:MAG: hypothetical protein HY913_12055 [Desulfomonile tiedjei]|nr:hypothetical protein [Desulfomonile tiedjei]